MKRYRVKCEERKNVSGHKRFPREYVFSAEHKRRKELRKEGISNTSESHDHQTEMLKCCDITIVMFFLGK